MSKQEVKEESKENEGTRRSRARSGACSAIWPAAG